MIKDAKTLLDEASKNPETDELFNRAPPLDQKFEALIEKLRSERASWGGVDQSDEREE